MFNYDNEDLIIDEQIDYISKVYDRSALIFGTLLFSLLFGYIIEPSLLVSFLLIVVGSSYCHFIYDKTDYEEDSIYMFHFNMGILISMLCNNNMINTLILMIIPLIISLTLLSRLIRYLPILSLFNIVSHLLILAIDGIFIYNASSYLIPIITPIRMYTMLYLYSAILIVRIFTLIYK
jgi:hypothetical protein